MRLTSIKLAGFKSFAELVTFPTAANLTGIVGPNGCGKSNVVDAIRWVMGERSASAIRGEDMQDVIFNGSINRPAINRASVELLFSPVKLPNNSPWSKFSELSIKRLMYRNKTSDYLINGQKVRRKDIADLFMGTGLGPRSYAIIEQGMVSRIVESNPKDLRVYLEEAAGVSKYKERRRETENRMEDTRANLLRVEDIRVTVAEQVDRLREQAKIALEYKNLQDNFLANQRLISVIQLQILITENADHRTALQKEISSTTELQSQKTSLETLLVTSEEEWQNQQNILEETQSNLSAYQAQVYELEQNLRLGEQSRQNLNNNHDKLTERVESLKEQKDNLQLEIESFAEQKEEVSEKKKFANEEFLETRQKLYQVEKDLSNQKQKHDELRRQEAIQASTTGAKVQEKNSAEHRIIEINSELQENKKILENLPQSDDTSDKQTSESFPEAEQLFSLRDEHEIVNEQLQNLVENIAQLDDENIGLVAKINLHKQNESELNGKIRMLERQMQAMASANGEALTNWLTENKMLPSLALSDNIQSEGKWKHAIYVILEEWLSARYLSNLLTDNINKTNEPPQGALIINNPNPTVNNKKNGSLAEYFGVDDPAYSSFVLQKLNKYICCEDWLAAVHKRDELADDEFFVSPEGVQVGRECVIFAGEGGERAIHLENLQALDSAKSEIIINSEILQKLLLEQEEGNKSRERQKSAQQNLITKTQILSSQIDDIKQSQQQWEFEQKSQRDKSAWQISQLTAQINSLQEQQVTWQEKLENLSSSLEQEEQDDNNLQKQIIIEQALVDELELNLRNVRESQHQGEIKVREFEQILTQVGRELERSNEQFTKIEISIEQNVEQLEAINEQLQDIPDGESSDEELQNLLDERKELEETKKEILLSVNSFGEKLRAIRVDIQKCDMQMQKSRDKLEALRLKNQESELLAKNYREHYVRFGGELDNIEGDNINAIVQPNLEKINNTSLKKLQQEVVATEAQMQALEPVNLGAISELETESQKLEHLVAQQVDLTEALTTLTDAITSIDSETRDRMQEVFKTVNVKFREYFTRIFGGGNAEIILSGEEILDSGIILKAQPLGKKNSSIHLLSGGEKALTAIALIFAFFALNPAPFCVLDEIDAPLDDNNTRLFTELIISISKQTQFLIITHNRITMEVMETLTGVTMSEPGISKMVAVDLLNSLQPTHL